MNCFQGIDIMSKRCGYISCVILTLLAAIFLFACSGEDEASGDGDADGIDSSVDGDDRADGDTDSADPCAALQCEPGGECLKKKNGNPYCFCDDGYYANNGLTKCLPRNIDGDTDRDRDYDTTACNPASTPWPSLPCCDSDGSGPRPCIIDLDFEYTNDIGEFTLGFRDARVLDSFDVSGDKIALIQWMSEGNPKNGIKIFDYKTK